MTLPRSPCPPSLRGVSHRDRGSVLKSTGDCHDDLRSPRNDSVIFKRAPSIRRGRPLDVPFTNVRNITWGAAGWPTPTIPTVPWPPP